MEPAQEHAKFVWLVALIIAFSVASLASFNDAATQNESLTFGLGLLAGAFLIPVLLSTILVGIAWLIAQSFPGKKWTGTRWLNVGALLSLALTIFLSVLWPYWMRPHLMSAASVSTGASVAEVGPLVVPQALPPVTAPKQEAPSPDVLPVVNQAPSRVVEQVTPPTPSIAKPQEQTTGEGNAEKQDDSNLVLVNPGGNPPLWYDPQSVKSLAPGLVGVNFGWGHKDNEHFGITPGIYNCWNGSLLIRNAPAPVSNPNYPFDVLRTIVCSER